MKKISLASLLIVTFTFVFSIATPAVTSAATRVKGYTNKKSYKYVAPHHRSSPNMTKIDNFSTKGNVNPYTGKKGTKPLYSAPKFKTHY